MSKRWVLAAAVLSLFLAAAAPVCAAQSPSEKEEVVYADLSAAGQVKHIYVVNIFEGQKSILDYGNYESVRNMTSTDKISQNGDKITLQTNDDMIYYQGDLKNGQLPWKIALTYYLDGTKTEPEKLAGRSGLMRLHMDLSKNEAADEAFFDRYAMQVTVVLDTEKCENIQAKGATEANAGGNKQLTWTILPGKEKTIELEANVKKFEMESIAFNGVKLDMDVDVDSKVLTDKFDQLSAAVSAINSGAEKLSSGTADLNQGAKQLKKGTDTLDKKIRELKKQTDKAQKLGPASKEVKGAVETLSQGITQLKEAQSYQQYKTLMAQNGLDVDQLKAQNQQMLQMLDGLEAAYGKNLPEAQKKQLEAQIQNAKKLLQGNNAAINGFEKYLNGLSEKTAAAENGAKTLTQKYGEFDQGIQTLTNQLSNLDLSQLEQLTGGAKRLESGSESLSSGSEKLAAGTGNLKQQTSGISGQVNKTIDEMLQDISGSDKKAKSFVSEKNTSVRGVQFVIKNDPIEITEPDPPAESADKKRSWWQKLLALFGLS